MAGSKFDSNKNFISAAKSIAYSAASLLGPSKCVKCVIEKDGQFDLTSSVVKLLQIIKVDHPAISIIHDVCKAFHKEYGTSCSTLVFMMGSWLQSIELFVDQGIPLQVVNRLMKEAVDVCTVEANNLSSSVSEITQFSGEIQSGVDISQSDFEKKERQSLGHLPESKFEVDNSASTDSAVSVRTSFNSRSSGGDFSNILRSNRKMVHGMGLKFSSRYSRHFTEADNAQKQVESLRILSKGIESISCGVARGNKIIEKLLIHLLELCKETSKDVRYLNELKVPMDRIFIEFVNGRSEMESTVLEGLCITASHADVIGFYHLFKNRPLNVCLIDFEKMKYSKQMISGDCTVDDGVQKLLLLKISCVLYRGEHSTLREHCLNKGILALKVNSPKHLYSISKVTKNPVVSSLHDLELKDIKRPVHLASVGSIQGQVGGGKEFDKLKSVISVQFPAETEEKYFTMLLYGMTSTMTSLLEERLWSCLNRLNNILSFGKYVFGSGYVERRCIQKLLRCSGKKYESVPKQSIPRWMEQELQIYRQIVYSEVAKGLERYCSRLSQNIDLPFAKGQVVDDVLSKCEAWRRAMRLVNMISRIDAIITK